MLYPTGKVGTLVLNHYINIEVSCASGQDLRLGGAAHIDYEPYIATDSLQAISGVEYRLWDVDWCKRESPGNIALRAIDCLRNSRYIEANINEFYLKGSSSFLRLNTRHHTLIYGYDERERSFLCAGYTRNGEYGVGRIHANLLSMAIVSSGADTPSCIRYASTIKVREIDVSRIVNGRLDLKAMSAQFCAFNEGRPCHGFWKRQHDPGAVFGHAAYNTVKEYLDNCSRIREPINVIITRFFWERQRIMQVRLLEIEKQFAEFRQYCFSRQWDAVQRRFYRVHLAAFGNRSGGSCGIDVGAEFELAAEADARLSEELQRALDYMGWSAA